MSASSREGGSGFVRRLGSDETVGNVRWVGRELVGYDSTLWYKLVGDSVEIKERILTVDGRWNECGLIKAFKLLEKLLPFRPSTVSNLGDGSFTFGTAS